MRADRLPDLVNQSQMGRRTTSEASVTVTFDIGDMMSELLAEEEPDAPTLVGADQGDAASSGPDHGNEAGTQGGTQGDGKEGDDKVVPLPFSHEWSVTRRLRVTSQGTYTSNYAINGEPCTLTQLHEQLQRFRIYPEGYNVVLQGDVTGIISMNPRERREIIDELAGVASFDRKIRQASDKLDVVQEREERFRIVEKELIVQRDRLAQDRLKAEKYQRLKEELQLRSQWEAVRLWQTQQRQIDAVRQQIQADIATATRLTTEIEALNETLATTTATLETLNTRVKALGEDEYLALQSQVATQEAELRQLHRQAQALTETQQNVAAQIRQAQIDRQQQQQTQANLEADIQSLSQGELRQLQGAVTQAQQALAEKREATREIANASQAWVEEQSRDRKAIEDRLKVLEPLRAEQVRLQERVSQLTQQIESLQGSLQDITTDLTGLSPSEAGPTTLEAAVQTQATTLATAEQELQLQRETHQRLLQEQRDKQRQLDRLEAQNQALQESQGTQATQRLLDSGLPDICGLVAQLGRVDPRFQLALEIAAGARLSYLVVENDRVAAQGINLLKQQRAGRATFLPLNSIRVPKFTPVPEWKRPDGLVDYAVNLIDCEPRFQKVFAFVFGGTAVFETLAAARSHLGQFRMVTLEGELMETSGAMTGGSLSQRRGRLHFGTVDPGESEEAIALKRRLTELNQIVAHCEQRIAAASAAVKAASQALIESRQQHRERQLETQQHQRQRQQLESQQQQTQARFGQYQQELTVAQSRLAELTTIIPEQEQTLQAQRTHLDQLEQSQTHQAWQQAQAAVQTLETHLSDRQQALQGAERRLQESQTQRERLTLEQQQTQTSLAALGQQQTHQDGQRQSLQQQQAELTQHIAQTRQSLTVLEATLATEKANRDRWEQTLREQQTQKQQLEWKHQKTLEAHQEHQQQLAALLAELASQAAELPDPLPEIPEEVDLEAVRTQMKSLQRRLEALEPVNMLALEEYNQTQERLEDLSHKLTTLEEERTELMLRIENFTTLRQRAFKEAFDAVNENFKATFAQLSDGDGFLQLDDPQNPFNGGLNLVAHPKGKQVRRLASMSGGEKSLTALSFIFALQRYRPSPFYAFDEVDMFLDGANVERLSKMIKHQAQQAQFIVVSLRRPMIEASQRTIGVTQARGAHTQVLGINLEAQSASM
jgi:chromosome segregation protein